MNGIEGRGSSKRTARRHIAEVLTREILDSPNVDDFLLATEEQLSKRFGVSRVTVRSALGELVYKGLIYRHHGSGTYARGSSTRANLSIGVFINCLETVKLPGFSEVLRGALTAVSPGRASLILVHAPPEEWPSEITGRLAGVIVFHESVVGGMLRLINERNLPFLLIRASRLLDASGNFFDMGRRAVQELTHAALTGEAVRELASTEVDTPGLDSQKNPIQDSSSS